MRDPLRNPLQAAPLIRSGAACCIGAPGRHPQTPGSAFPQRRPVHNASRKRARPCTDPDVGHAWALATSTNRPLDPHPRQSHRRPPEALANGFCNAMAGASPGSRSASGTAHPLAAQPPGSPGHRGLSRQEHGAGRHAALRVHGLGPGHHADEPDPVVLAQGKALHSLRRAPGSRFCLRCFPLPARRPVAARRRPAPACAVHRLLQLLCGGDGVFQPIVRVPPPLDLGCAPLQRGGLAECHRTGPGTVGWLCADLACRGVHGPGVHIVRCGLRAVPAGGSKAVAIPAGRAGVCGAFRPGHPEPAENPGPAAGCCAAIGPDAVVCRACFRGHPAGNGGDQPHAGGGARPAQ